MPDLRAIAHALGGEVVGGQVAAPGPGHSTKDRSMTVCLSASAPEGFMAFSHSGDDFRICRDYVRDRLGLTRMSERRPGQRLRQPIAQPKVYGSDEIARERAKAQFLWRQRRPIAGTIAETYLREARACRSIIPPTLGFLPSRGEHPPALIAAFGLCSEPEPGVLAIGDAAVRAVQLVKMKPDGSGKAEVEPNKTIIGRGALGSPIMLAPPNDLLGLAIAEGLEDALSIHEATGLGAWAAGGAGRMPALADAVKSYIDCITICSDDNGAGRRGVENLAGRLRKRGFEVIVKFPHAERRS